MLNFAKQMIGGTLVTHQTGPDGQVCRKVLINEGVSIEKEYYFAILMDRAAQGPVFVARCGALPRRGGARAAAACA